MIFESTPLKDNFIINLDPEINYIFGIQNDKTGIDWFKKQMSNFKKEYYIYEFYFSKKT